jgi:hypothetical protein
MKLVIKRDDNEMEATYELNACEQTVAELKELISAHNFGPIVEEQRLEFNNRRLKNSHFLAYYSLKENDVLVLKQQSASSSSSNSSTPSASDDEGGQNNQAHANRQN